MFVQRKKWIAKMFCLFYTLPALPENQKVWYIPAVDTWCIPVIHSSMFFSITQTIFSGAQPMWVGLRVIVMLYTDHCWLVQHRLFLKVFPLIPMREDFGM